jgi:hypothetical protein
VGPKRIEIAGAALRIKDGAGFVIAEGLERRPGLWRGGSRIGIEQEPAGDGVARECGGEPPPGGRCPSPNAIGTLRICFLELL